MATPIPTNKVKLTLGEVAQATGGALHGNPDLTIEGVAIDSRAIVPGALFVAIVGESLDGHRYVSSARDQGAAALLEQVREESDATLSELPRVEVPDTTRALGDLAAYVRQRWNRKIVAITGSAGKTTTKELTAAALTGAGARVLKTTGNLNNQFGVPMTLFGLTEEHDVAVLEVGTSMRGEIARLGEIVRPDVAIVLLASAAHTEGLGTLADVADEKASLWRSLADGGTAIVNADDAQLASRVPADACTMSFGTGEHVDVRLVRSELTLSGTEVVIFVRGHGELRVKLQLLGDAAAIDACAALIGSVALLGERALGAAALGLEQAQATPGRMQPRAGVGGLTLLDDTYNANPRSTELGLQTLKKLADATGGRSVAVLADMLDLGALSRTEHERIGELAVRMGIDVLVGCGRQMAHATGQAARLAGGRLAPHPTRVVQVLEPLDAIAVLKSFCRPGDVLLVKGSRSMAMERIVAALAAPSAHPSAQPSAASSAAASSKGEGQT